MLQQLGTRAIDDTTAAWYQGHWRYDSSLVPGPLTIQQQLGTRAIDDTTAAWYQGHWPYNSSLVPEPLTIRQQLGTRAIDNTTAAWYQGHWRYDSSLVPVPLTIQQQLGTRAIDDTTAAWYQGHWWYNSSLVPGPLTIRQQLGSVPRGFLVRYWTEPLTVRPSNKLSGLIVFHVDFYLDIGQSHWRYDRQACSAACFCLDIRQRRWWYNSRSEVFHVDFCFSWCLFNMLGDSFCSQCCFHFVLLSVSAFSCGEVALQIFIIVIIFMFCLPAKYSLQNRFLSGCCID